MARAVRSIRSDHQQAFRKNILWSLVPAAGAAGLITYSLLTKDYSVSDHAYASLFLIIEGFLALLLIGGVGMNIFVQYFARRGEYSSRRYISVENTSLYFYVSAVFAIITLAVLYGVPYLS